MRAALLSRPAPLRRNRRKTHVKPAEKTFDSMHRVIGRRASSPSPCPSTLCYASFRLLRLFILRCTGKGGRSRGRRGVADEFRVGGVTTCETPSHYAGQSAGRGARRESAGIAAALGDAPWSRRTAPEAPPPSSGLAVAGGASAVMLVGLLGRLGAGICPNLLQRRPGPGSAARRSAEYQRFSSGVSARSGPLQQIWTTCAPAGPSGRAVARRMVTTTGAPTREHVT